MASETFERNNVDGETQKDDITQPRDPDDATATAGSNREKNEAVEQEINVKWQLPGTADARRTKVQLQQLLACLMISHPGEVTIIDHKQREWSFQETEEEEKFLRECEEMAVTIHPIKNKSNQTIRWVAITRIQSFTNIHDWKENDQFYSAVTAAETYIFPHPFPHDTWDTTTIGFLKEIHTLHVPKEYIHAHLYDMIQKQTNNPPLFQLIPQRISTKDKKATTKAYTVQCARQDANDMLHLLTHGPFRESTNPMFVPFKYKSKQPELFTKCIRQQNEMFHKTWIIKLEGITEDIMNKIRPDIASIMGVMHLVPTKKLYETGEWKVLVDQTKCAYVHRQLSDTWRTIINRVHPDLLEAAPSHFTSPTISSRRARDYQDSESDNDSYGSLLTTATDVSNMTTDDTFLSDPPYESKYPSYASAAAQSTRSGTETQFSSPTTSTHTEWQREKQALEDQIRFQAEQLKTQALMIEQIQADLQAKIACNHETQVQLAQALELSHSRDVRHVELMQKFEQLMSFHTTTTSPTTPAPMANPGTTEAQPTTPERAFPFPPPPSKKPNTNSSPHRNLYNIFRQTNAKQSAASRPSPKGKEKPRPPATNESLTQPMETDEVTRQPTPEAKSGHHSK